MNNSADSSSAPFWVDINVVNTSLSPGTYSAILRFNNVQTVPTTKVLGYQDVAVTYTVTNALSVSTDALTFNVVNNGSSASPAQTITIYGSLGWSAKVSDTWLQLSPMSGTAPGSLDANIAALGTTLSPGTYNGSIVLTSSPDNQTKTINVTLNVEAQRVFVAKKAIAFTKLPSRSKLTENIPITVNGGDAVQWTAQEDNGGVSWLTINNTNSTGTTGTDPLSITADPTSLVDGLYRAGITVSSPSTGNTQTIQVALYVQSTAVTNRTITYTNPVYNSAGATVADPMRPYVYTTDGGSDISVYNIYTGALEKTVTVSGGQLTDLTINASGTLLFAANKADYTIAEVDLESQSVKQTFTGTGSYFSDSTSAPRLVYAEPNGYPVLITSSLEIADAANGTVLDSISSPTNGYSRRIAFSPGSDLLFVADNSPSLNEYYRYQLNYSYLSGVGMSHSWTKQAEYSGTIVGFALTPDGSRLCTAIDSVAQLTCLSTADLSDSLDIVLPGNGAGVVIDTVGNIYGSFSTYPDLTKPDVEHFNANGTQQADTYDAGQYVDKDQLTVSGDGLRLIVRGGTLTSTSLYIDDTSL